MQKKKIHHISVAFDCSASCLLSGQYYPKRNNAVFLEIGGTTGNLYGVGYERKIYEKKRWTIYGRAGISVLPVRLIIRAGLYNLGAHAETGFRWGGKRNKLEVGMSFAYYYGYEEQYKFTNPEHGSDTDAKFLILRLGYRRISKNGFWYYNIAFTPFHIMDRFQPGDYYINNWVDPGVGLGIGFQF